MTPRQRFMLIAPGVLFLVAFGAFELGGLAERESAKRKRAADDANKRAENLVQDDATLMKTLLAQDLAERTFDFPGVIEGATGQHTRPFDPTQPPAAKILAAIRSAADEAIKLHNTAESPIRGLRRINEASRFFEDTLRALIDEDPDLFCTVPQTVDGSGQRSGYPDLRIEHVASGTIAYLDPKLFEEGSRSSSFRTFYYTPSSDSSKVHDSAFHLLLGISHDGVDGRWTFTGWELIDLSHLKVRLKAEFQASNRDLYREEARVATSQAAE
ncbi:MAG: hypothetical protein VCA35_09730 [Roseibacillus sp.]